MPKGVEFRGWKKSVVWEFISFCLNTVSQKCANRLNILIVGVWLKLQNFELKQKVQTLSAFDTSKFWQWISRRNSIFLAHNSVFQHVISRLQTRGEKFKFLFSAFLYCSGPVRNEQTCRKNTRSYIQVVINTTHHRWKTVVFSNCWKFAFWSWIEREICEFWRENQLSWLLFGIETNKFKRDLVLFSDAVNVQSWSQCAMIVGRSIQFTLPKT